MNRLVAFTLLALLAACGEGGSGAAVIPGGGGGPTPTPAPVSTATAGPLPTDVRYWIMQGQAGNSMANDPVGKTYFAQAKHEVLVSSDVIPPSGWNTIVFATYTSFSGFQTALNNGSVPSDVTAVLYDNEEEPGWTATPADEQADPTGFMQRFASLARGAGYLVIGTHAGGGSSEKDIDAGMAPWCNFFGIQTQSNEILAPAPNNYVGYTKLLAAAIQGASPNTVIIGGITTAVQGTLATPSQIDQAITATANTPLLGYWLNIPTQSTFDPNGPPPSEYSTEVQNASQALQALPSPAP